MITMFKSRVRSRFKSRDAAWAAAWKLSLLVPGYDFEPWPDRGCWVLVMRYRDDDGHIRFQFAGPGDPLSAAEPKPRKPEPRCRNPNERPLAHDIGDRGDESARRHRRVYGEAMQQ